MLFIETDVKKYNDARATHPWIWR